MLPNFRGLLVTSTTTACLFCAVYIPPSPCHQTLSSWIFLIQNFLERLLEYPADLSVQPLVRLTFLCLLLPEVLDRVNFH